MEKSWKQIHITGPQKSERLRKATIDHKCYKYRLCPALIKKQGVTDHAWLGDWTDLPSPNGRMKSLHMTVMMKKLRSSDSLTKVWTVYGFGFKNCATDPFVGRLCLWEAILWYFWELGSYVSIADLAIRSVNVPVYSNARNKQNQMKR